MVIHSDPYLFSLKNILNIHDNLVGDMGSVFLRILATMGSYGLWFISDFIENLAYYYRYSFTAAADSHFYDFSVTFETTGKFSSIEKNQPP